MSSLVNIADGESMQMSDAIALLKYAEAEALHEWLAQRTDD